MMTRELAAYAAGLNYGKIPPATIAMAKRLLLDGVGCLLAGINGEPARSAAKMARELGGEKQATILPGNTMGSVRDAAFVNGISLYSVGLNDVHSASGAHPGGCILPVVLGMSEWLRVPGEKLLTSMVAGSEVNGRVGRAIIPSHRQRGFHPTGTCGTFGATTTACFLLGFEAEQIASALGIAGSQAAGLYECHHDGTSTMIFHAGRAAQNGVEAALLARAGLTGPATVLEGSKGFLQATSNASDIAGAMRDLGQRYELDSTSFRPYFGCSSTISSSGAMARIMKRSKINAEDVEEITVRCHDIVAHDNADADPHTMLAARLSLPFNVGLVIVHGDVLAADLEESELYNPRVRALLPKIKLISDPAMKRRGVNLHLRLKGGRTETETIDVPRGSASNPLTWEDIVDKFKPLVRPVIAEKHQLKIIAAVANIEASDGAAFMGVLREAVKDSLQVR